MATGRSAPRKSTRTNQRAINTETVRAIALELPESTEAPHFDMQSFRVGGKIFATMPKDGLQLHVFVDDSAREQWIATYPAAIEKLWWGKKVVGLRVNLSLVDGAIVTSLLQSAWMRKAPKRLLTKA